jgi:hypothetical protein
MPHLTLLKVQTIGSASNCQWIAAKFLFPENSCNKYFDQKTAGTCTNDNCRTSFLYWLVQFGRFYPISKLM